MNHFMLDLETLGTSPGCVILSIGLIAFDPQADNVAHVFCDNGYQTVISQESCADAMLHRDADTVAWWDKQSSAARDVIAASLDPLRSVSLTEGLGGMVEYVAENVSPRNARIWGNGADFDNPILNVAARMAGVKLPWQWGGRCYRTIKNLTELLGPEHSAPPVTRLGTYHNALDDARTQALHMWDIVHTLRGKL